MSQTKEELARITAALEAADDALVAALDARARAMRAFRALRERDPEGYHQLPRDADVLDRARKATKDFPPAAVDLVLREVLSASTALVAPVAVAFLGPPGSFAHAAARRQFGAAAELRPLDDVRGVLDEVARGRTSFGVVPLETSSDGALSATLHGLLEMDVRIVAELTTPASYHLTSTTGNTSDVEKVYGTPAALAACARFLRETLPRATLIDVRSGEMATELARDDHGAAALTTEVSREAHGLRSVRDRVEDVTGVETRFAVVGTEHPSRTGADRTIVALAVHDQPGALYKALQPFADRNINLTRLESRPGLGTAWRYVFFVELDGHVTDRPVLTALEELRTETRFLRILGSYPRPR